MKESVMCQYLHNNREALQTFSLPWFLPEHLCGVGLPTVGKYAPCRFDLQVARKVLENPDKFPVPALKPDVPWKVWKYAQGRFKATSAAIFNVAHGNRPGMMSENDILGAFCVESIFRVGLKEIFEGEKREEDVPAASGVTAKTEMTAAFKAMRNIQKVWLRARENTSIQLGGPLPTPIPPPIPSGSSIPFAFLTHTSRLLSE
jgi:hypothetical protein